ncbi:TPA: hypothetical protein DCF80_00325 [Candidatus Saccharibacteria bacterium]|nr:hypothetical protein [Candidatus Saccharibacteria bacterium]HRK40475.1 L-threonylcarbamoyladenylate synthase [Candidatus Saccharibacteria bacterium]
MFEKLASNQELISLLKNGGVAVLRTDTLYGIVASADDPDAVERVYAAKHRNPQKSCIILLADPKASYAHSDELAHDIELYHETPTSFLIASPGAPHWLLRQNDELAYRVPADQDLRELLQQTGPLIAPSANPEGEPPAQTIEGAKHYFGDMVDMYVDGGVVSADTPPSQLLRIHPDGSQERLR